MAVLQPGQPAVDLDQPHNTLFFTAGPNKAANGLYGRIDLPAMSKDAGDEGAPKGLSAPAGRRASAAVHLSGLLQCAEFEAGFVPSNGTRYQCASHLNGANSACSVNLILPRDLAEWKIISFTCTELFNPDRLAEKFFKRHSLRPLTIPAD